tara:strand:- start:1172 stop:1309 length:138 start_codon:yes stop_codon:yes gene_type:complete
MNEVIVKNILKKINKLAIQYNKTKDPRIKDQWYKAVKEAAIHLPK